MTQRVWRKWGSRSDLGRNWRLGMVCDVFFISFMFAKLFFFFVDLMVPAARSAHPPKYKLFGGRCYP